MGKAMESAKKARADNSQKWEDYFNQGNPWSLEIQRQMDEDNEKVAELCKMATKEWLAEKGVSR